MWNGVCAVLSIKWRRLHFRSDGLLRFGLRKFPDQRLKYIFAEPALRLADCDNESHSVVNAFNLRKFKITFSSGMFS